MRIANILLIANVLLYVIALSAVPALADETGHWYVTPQAGGLWTDDDRSIEDEEWLFGVAAGKHLGERWSTELSFNTAELEASNGSEVNLRAASLDVLRVFARKSSIAPYITLGMGALQNDLSPGPRDTDFMAQAGIGLMLHTWQSESGARTFTLRPELKARWADVGRLGYYTDYLATLGFQLSFGRGRAAQIATAAAPVLAPEPALVPEPSLPPPPPDTDSDGVQDVKDRCPGTPRGVAIDADGCSRKGSVTLEGVTFELNSADLTAASRPVLARVAADLMKYPKLRIEVQGHTDSTGAEQYNLRLSALRAASVREYLLAQGVAPRQVEARGHGEAEPIADNRTVEGRARNRRVVMVVLDNPAHVGVNEDGL